MRFARYVARFEECAQKMIRYKQRKACWYIQLLNALAFLLAQGYNKIVEFQKYLPLPS